MAFQTSNQLTTKDVALIFVNQYYNPEILTNFEVLKFYEDSSLLGRPGLAVTTLIDINDKSMVFESYKGRELKIKECFAEESLLEGVVIVRVVGDLTGKDNVTRSFTQTFHLAQRRRGFYCVSSDFLQFADVLEASISLPVNVHVHEDVPITESPEVSDKPDMEHSVVQEVATISMPEANQTSVQEVDVSSMALANQSQKDVGQVTLPVPTAQENDQKLSYASKLTTMTSRVQKPATAIVRVSPNHDQQPSASVEAEQPPKQAVAPAPQNSTPQSPEPRTIFIGNLPYDVERHRVYEAVKKFGHVTGFANGVQIRTNHRGFTMGFVYFDSPNSARKAVKARNITVDGQVCYIEYKKSSTQNGNNRSGGGGGGSGRGLAPQKVHLNGGGTSLKRRANQSQKKDVVQVTEPVPSSQEKKKDVVQVTEPVPSGQENAKPSYASMAKSSAPACKPATTIVRVLESSAQAQKPTTTIVRVLAAEHEQQPSDSQESKPQPTKQTAAPALGPPAAPKNAEPRSIFIPNLPYEITRQKVYDAVKIFGPVERGRFGVNVKTWDGRSKAFVKFESSSSARKAYDAKRITIEGRVCKMFYRNLVARDDVISQNGVAWY